MPETHTKNAYKLSQVNIESTRWLVLKSLIYFSVASISMILLNKASISIFPDISCLLVLQNLTTVLMLKIKNGDSIQFHQSIAKQWLICAFLFCLNIASSLQSLAFISVPTFTVLRNTQPLLALVLETGIQKKDLKWDSIFYLFGVLIGAVVYCMHDLDFDLNGYICAIVHVLSMTFYSIFVKQKSNELKLSSEEMSYYNNVLSLPFLAISACFRFFLDPAYSPQTSIFLCTKELKCIAIVLASCIGGFCISVTAFQAQKMISPTSFLCLNNVSKVPASLISLALFGGFYSFATFHGMFISLSCASFYSIANLGKTSEMMKLTNLFLMASALFWSTDYKYMTRTSSLIYLTN